MRKNVYLCKQITKIARQMTKKLLTLAFLLAFTIETLPQSLIAHPWQGKRVAYFGDSITDPRNNGSKKK